MHKRSYRLSFLLGVLLAAAVSILEVHAATCPKVVLANDGSTSGNERAPNGNFQYGRAVYLVSAAELAASGLTNGAAITGIGWNYAVRPGVAVTGSLKVYLENTSAASNAKSLTWTSAISTMTLVHDASTSLPDAAGPWNVTFSGGAAFTYNGQALYVAFDWQNPGGGGGTGSVLGSSNTGPVGSNGLKGSQSNTSPPPTLANSSFRPETQLPLPASNNDASVDALGTFGVLPEGLAGPETVTAVVSNKGGLALTNLQVSLSVAGATPFTDTKTVASLAACGGRTTVTFTPYAPLHFNPAALGINTVTVSVPADDAAANNSKSVPQSITANQYAYKYPGTSASGAFGFNGVTGEIDAKFSAAVDTDIDAVTLEFPAATGALYKLAIRQDDGSGLPGALVYVDASNRTVTSSGPVTIRLPFSVSVSQGLFFVGVRQTGTTNVGVSYDAETPIRAGAFYRQSPLDSGLWSDFLDAGLQIKLNVGATLGDCLVPLNVDVTPDGTSTSCIGGSIVFAANVSGGTGSFTYQWTQDGVDIPSATTSSYAASMGAPGSAVYNVKVMDDAGCVDVQDVQDATGTWAAPPTATVASGGGICPGGSIAIHADLTGTGPWNVAWSDGVNQNGVTTSPAARIVSPASTTSYTVTSVSDTRCGGSVSGTATVTVTPPPPETAVDSGPGTFLDWSSKTQLLWPSNASANGYRMYRGTRPDLPNLLNTSIDSCVKFEGAAATASDTSAINPGTLFWYLVAGVANGCEGNVGNAYVNGVATPRIPNASGACP